MNPIQTSPAPTLTIRRTFAASRARVFAALTDVEMVRQWFVPDGSPCDAQWDARDGGAYRVAMNISNGEQYIVFGVFSEVRPPERLAFSFRWVEDDPAQERDTFVTIDLIERGSETELVMVQTNLRDETSRDNHIGGWNASLDNLARLLST